MTRSLVFSVVFASYATAVLIERLKSPADDPGVDEGAIQRLLKRAQLPTDTTGSAPGSDARSAPGRAKHHASGNVLVIGFFSGVHAAVNTSSVSPAVAAFVNAAASHRAEWGDAVSGHDNVPAFTRFALATSLAAAQAAAGRFVDDHRKQHPPLALTAQERRVSGANVSHWVRGRANGFQAFPAAEIACKSSASGGCTCGARLSPRANVLRHSFDNDGTFAENVGSWQDRECVRALLGVSKDEGIHCLESEGCFMDRDTNDDYEAGNLACVVMLRQLPVPTHGDCDSAETRTNRVRLRQSSTKGKKFKFLVRSQGKCGKGKAGRIKSVTRCSAAATALGLWPSLRRPSEWGKAMSVEIPGAPRGCIIHDGELLFNTAGSVKCSHTYACICQKKVNAKTSEPAKKGQVVLNEVEVWQPMVGTAAPAPILSARGSAFLRDEKLDARIRSQFHAGRAGGEAAAVPTVDLPMARWEGQALQFICRNRLPALVPNTAFWRNVIAAAPATLRGELQVAGNTEVSQNNEDLIATQITPAAIVHARLMRLAFLEAVAMMPEHIAAVFTYIDVDKPQTSESRGLSENDIKTVPELANFQPGYGIEHREHLPAIRAWSAGGNGPGNVQKIHILRGGGPTSSDGDGDGDGDSFVPPKSDGERAHVEARLAAWFNGIDEQSATDFGVLEKAQLLDAVDDAEIAAAERGKEWLNDLARSNSPDDLTSLCNPLEGCFLDEYSPLPQATRESFVANGSNGKQGWRLGWNDLMLHLDKRGYTLFTDPVDYLPLLQQAVKEYPSDKHKRV
eukprot:g2384.t1